MVWYDEAGSLASTFSFRFIKESQSQGKPLIYVSFDRSPKTILEDLGPLSESQHLTILDCFTHGKGDGSELFSKFFEKDGARWPYQIVQVNEPSIPDMVAESIYSLHNTMKGDVRFVFDTLTGMQDLWGGEESILKFYSRSCPRLYELDRIVFSGGGSKVSFPDHPRDGLSGYRLSPADFDAKAEPYLIDIPPGQVLKSHFFVHKGEEVGYVLAGDLKVTVNSVAHRASAGDVIYLTSDLPSQWENIGSEMCRLFWLKVK